MSKTSSSSTPQLKPVGMEDGELTPATSPTPSSSHPHAPPAQQQAHVPASDPDALRNLIVNYLPPFMDEVQLMNLFGQFGPIEKVKIIYDKVTGESRGYGFVLFQFFFSATYAISYLNRSTIAGKKLKVGYASVTAAKEAYEAMKGSATAFSAPQQQTLEYMYRSQAALTGGEQYGASYNQPAYGGSAYAYTQ